MKSKYHSHSLHFVFYTLSTGSWTCLAQSVHVDAALPSFPYQNSLADCLTLPLQIWTTSTSPLPPNVKDNVSVLHYMPQLLPLTLADWSPCAL